MRALPGLPPGTRSLYRPGMTALPRPTGPDAAAASVAAAVRPAWVSGIIIALFIALASALLPGSTPASQQVGSAFNPATTQVALSRQQGDAIAVAEPAHDRLRLGSGGDGDAAASYSWASPAAIAAAALADTGLSLSVRAIAWVDHPASARPGTPPRAPPLTA